MLVLVVTQCSTSIRMFQPSTRRSVPGAAAASSASAAASSSSAAVASASSSSVVDDLRRVLALNEEYATFLRNQLDALSALQAANSEKQRLVAQLAERNAQADPSDPPKKDILINRASIFAAPFFVDKHGATPPPNPDTLRKQRLRGTMPAEHKFVPWTALERDHLQRGVRAQNQKHIMKQAMERSEHEHSNKRSSRGLLHTAHSHACLILIRFCFASLLCFAQGEISTVLTARSRCTDIRYQRRQCSHAIAAADRVPSDRRRHRLEPYLGAICAIQIGDRVQDPVERSRGSRH